MPRARNSGDMGTAVQKKSQPPRSGPDAIVLVEAVNFDATINDTNDISTIRGSSLALLRMVDAAETVARSAHSDAGAGPSELRITGKGASILELALSKTPADQIDRVVDAICDALYTSTRSIVSQPGGADWTGHIDLSRFCIQIAIARREELPLARLTNGPAGPHAQMLALARSRLRRAQMQSAGFAPPHKDDLPVWSGFLGLCAAGSGLPATVDNGGSRVATSVARRRDFGRTARNGIWSDLAGKLKDGDVLSNRPDGQQTSFAQSLQDLLLDKKEADALQLPPAVRGKIALIHIDGNGFATIKNRLKDATAQAKFSQQLRAMHGRLLKQLIEAGLSGTIPSLVSAGTDHVSLRLEILMMGGDEIILAVPAHCALDVLALAQAALAGQSVDPAFFALGQSGGSLTHAAALVFAGAKTPIRQIRQAAGELLDIAKSGKSGRDGFNSAILTMEGFALPNGGAARVLRDHYGLADDTAASLASFVERKWNALPADRPGPGFDWALRDLRRLKANLPISQAIRLQQEGEGKSGSDWLKFATAELERVESHAGKRDAIVAALSSRALSTDGQSPELALKHYRLLHDYLGRVPPARAVARAAAGAAT